MKMQTAWIDRNQLLEAAGDYSNPELVSVMGASGTGSYHGRWGFEAFSHARAVVHQHDPALAGVFYPPYDNTRARLATRALRVLE